MGKISPNDKHTHKTSMICKNSYIEHICYSENTLWNSETRKGKENDRASIKIEVQGHIHCDIKEYKL
jgi:hypothetical protein